jgi:hypothetical protein
MGELTIDDILSKATGVQDNGLRTLPGVAAMVTDLKG